jgi:hypothetical protein
MIRKRAVELGADRSPVQADPVRGGTGVTADDTTGPALDGLARELEALRRHVDELDPLPRRVDDLAHLFARLADTTAGGRTGTVAARPVQSWLDHPLGSDRQDVEVLLVRLAQWVEGVYLRYTDARHLPDCWLWHPDAVEELVWLRAAWLAAYAPEAPANAAGDWHDRQRPGVVRRIRDYAGLCSLEAHLPGGERHASALAAPTADATVVIAAWWATCRDQPAPAPSQEQLDAARLRHQRGARR